MTKKPLPQAAQQVIDFWVSAGPDKWFAKDAEFDAQFRSRFFALHMQAAARQLDDWSESAQGCLALLILLDQFPRNAFRGTAHMFATDALALYFARHAQAQGFQAQLDKALQVFMVLPFEHSEVLQDQLTAVALCQGLDPRTLEFAQIHRDVIQRFGRFPHRNAVLGRQTTQAEQAFLDQGGFGG
jgi:uncharacterized protein (DUF924 family)